MQETLQRHCPQVSTASFSLCGEGGCAIDDHKVEKITRELRKHRRQLRR